MSSKIKEAVKKLPDFPHFSRIFSARFWRRFVSLTLWGLIALFFLFVLILLAIPTSSPERLSLSILEDYQSPKNHLALAKRYEETNDLENAKRELLLALGCAPEDKSTKIELEKVDQLLAQPDEVRQEIEAWEQITQDFPGYRDAYLKLTVLYFTLYQNDKARENLDKALRLDPNFEPAKDFERVLNKTFD